MEKNLIPSARAEESKMPYYNMKGGDYRHLAELATRGAKSKAAEDARVAYAEAMKVLKNIEVPQVQYVGKIGDVSVVRQGQVLTIRTVQKTVEVPQDQFLDPEVDVPVVVQRQVPVPRTMKEIMKVSQLLPQEQILERVVEETGVPVPRVMEETIEVKKLKSQLSRRESTLLADNKLASKTDGSWATQAPEWEQRQRVRAEELVTIHDTNKLLNDNDSLEFFKETLPSPSLVQPQSDKRSVARQARAVVRNSSGSPGVNLISVSLFQQEHADDDDKKTYCLISIGRAEDGDTSLAIDTKSHETAIADPQIHQVQRSS